MQISGNGSSDFLLHWTQDRIASTMPQPSVLSLHIFVFKGLMLMWALWLAYSLILKWLPWGWSCFSEGGLWKKASPQNVVLTLTSITPHIVNFLSALKGERSRHPSHRLVYFITAWILLFWIATLLVPSENLNVFLFKNKFFLARGSLAL